MKLYIPEIGDSMTLSSDWKFKLYVEYRNKSLFKYFNLPFQHGCNEYDDVTLPSGTVLKIDRIYIRKGLSDFSSVSFYATIPKYKNSVRFWVKLDDVNNIQYDNTVAVVRDKYSKIKIVSERSIDHPYDVVTIINCNNNEYTEKYKCSCETGQLIKQTTEEKIYAYKQTEYYNPPVYVARVSTYVRAEKQKSMFKKSYAIKLTRITDNTYELYDEKNQVYLGVSSTDRHKFMNNVKKYHIAKLKLEDEQKNE